MRGWRILVGLVASTALMAAPAMAREYNFEKVAEIHLDGMTGHGDIVTFDPTNQMLYVTMHGNGLNVVDTRTNQVVAYIDDIPSPNGVDYDSSYVYVATADGPPAPAAAGAGSIVTNAIYVVSKANWKVIGKVDTHGTSPDWLAVDRESGTIYTDSDDRAWMEVYSAGADPQLKAKWHLHPLNSNHWWLDTTDFTGPDVGTLVPSRHEIFQSIDSYVEVLDMSGGGIKRMVDTGVPLTGKGGTKGEAYDARNQRLWVATTDHKMFVMNPDTLAIIKELPQKGGADQVAFDPNLGMVYAFEGGAQGFDAYDANTMEHVGFVSTGIGQTHTGDVDPATHRVFAFGGNDRVIYVYQPGGMPMVSSFTVYFAFNKSALTADARKIISEAVAYSRQHGTAHIQVNGYTDLAGTARYNLGLSKRRADAVRTALVADGIVKNRISERAYGESNPAVPTPDGVREPRNRRAVIIVGTPSTM
jgi:outer membrane protein OmpA-like peptidoglycan-associated protein